MDVFYSHLQLKELYSVRLCLKLFAPNKFFQDFVCVCVFGFVVITAVAAAFFDFIAKSEFTFALRMVER